MKIKYTRQGDYLIPNLTLKEEENFGRFGKYGMLRLHFIAKNKKAFYTSLLMKNKLNYHLVSVGKTCDDLYETLMQTYIKNDERLSEKSKNLNPIEWASLMNNYKNMAEEIILKEYIYV